MSGTPRTPASAGKRAVVVGAGIAGLATAALLARDGYDVTVLEQRDEVGGRAGVWESEGFRFDTGPSWYLMSEVFDHFFRLCGTSEAEQIELVDLDPAYRVIFEDEYSSIDIGPTREATLETFERVEPGASLRMVGYLESARETYEMALRSFLYSTFEDVRTTFSAPVLKRSPRLVRLLLEPLARFAAHTVRDPRLQQVLGYPAVFLGTSPYAAPSMYHLMSYLDLDQSVRYPLGGIASVIERIATLAERGGATIRLNSRATRIVTAHNGADSGRPTVSAVEYVDENGQPAVLPADVVVAAADLPGLEAQLLPPELQTYPEAYWDKRTPGPGAVLLYLGVRGELPELTHHTLLFARDWQEEFAEIFPANGRTSATEPRAAKSLYVCKPSATDPDVAPQGHENVFVLVPVAADVDLGGGGDPRVEAIADAAIDQIAGWAGVPDLHERIVVRRSVGPADFERDLGAWRGSALGPAHTLRQSAFFRARNVSTHVDGLFFAGGTTTPGIGLPMCLISAELVIKRLRGDRTPHPLPEPL